MPGESNPTEYLKMIVRPRHRVWRDVTDYVNFYERMKTFVDWPTTAHQSPEKLAENGFIYTRKSDKVSCYFCGGIISQWGRNDVPHELHKAYYPECVFVNGWDACVSRFGSYEDGMFARETEENKLFDRIMNDLPSGYEFPFCYVSKSTQASHEKRLDLSCGSASRKYERYPAHFAYETIEARLESFESWSEVPDALRLAEAGFFYVGLTDHVRCFYCSTSLRNWRSDDDPWMTHAFYVDQCRYLFDMMMLR